MWLYNTLMGLLSQSNFVVLLQLCEPKKENQLAYLQEYNSSVRQYTALSCLLI